MCWLTKAWPSTTRVIVFLRSAPRARMGRSVGKRGGGSGGISARPAKNGWAENARAGNRIVHAPGDGPLAD